MFLSIPIPIERRVGLVFGPPASALADYHFNPRAENYSFEVAEPCSPGDGLCNARKREEAAFLWTEKCLQT